MFRNISLLSWDPASLTMTPRYFPLARFRCEERLRSEVTSFETSRPSKPLLKYLDHEGRLDGVSSVAIQLVPKLVLSLPLRGGFGS